MTLIVLAAALGALAYLSLTARPASLVRSGVKTLSVALLAIAAWMSGAPVPLTVALALCALGDWLLSRETEPAFMAGVAAFAAGHIAYVILFLAHPVADPGRITQAPGLWIGIALVVLGGIMAAILAPRAGALRGPVLAYIPVIIGMGLSVLALPHTGPLALAAPAALAFVISDMILATEKFLLPDGHPARRVTPYAIWLLYWGAQAGFLAAFA